MAAANEYQTSLRLEMTLVSILAHSGVTLSNPNERGQRHHRIYPFRKDLVARLLGCDLEADINERNLYFLKFIISPS